MLIQYFLADGQEITYDTGDNTVNCNVINDLAMIYAEKRPRDLPTDVFLHISIYRDLVNSLSYKPTTITETQRPQLIQIMTECGPLIVHPTPWAFNGFKVLVGKREDFDRYDIDKVFEEIVLRDCDREK